MIESINRLGDDRSAFLDLLLYADSRGIQPTVRRLLGDALFAEFLSAFSGMTVKVNRTQIVRRWLDRFELAKKYEAFHRAFKRKDFDAGRVLEQDFERIRKRMRIQRKRAVTIAQQTLRKIADARAWSLKLNAPLREVDDDVVSVGMVPVFNRDPHSARQGGKQGEL